MVSAVGNENTVIKPPTAVLLVRVYTYCQLHVPEFGDQSDGVMVSAVGNKNAVIKEHRSWKRKYGKFSPPF